jgi:hypothetical protein
LAVEAYGGEEEHVGVVRDSSWGPALAEESPELKAALQAQVSPFLRAGYQYRPLQQKPTTVFLLQGGGRWAIPVQLLEGRDFAVAAVAQGPMTLTWQCSS